ncbi:EXLDI protein [Nocardia sp. SYP-A9097]|uniref:EXLDI protein n=1 Tax=Nocardia sp. SYP-A9097 TaxID=2663237 RepID=UPI00129ACE1B|nr:EXLDI protein [Nocardia sp. SYP-A9097]MRH91614.1 EXLDI protein [Nocardia sp. SYP-A9097]
MDIDMQKPDADEPTPGALVTQDFPEGMSRVELRVGPGGGRTQSFVGRLLAESQQVSKVGTEVVNVYLSRKGKFVVHRHYIEWADFQQATKLAYHTAKDEFIVARRNSDQSDFSPITNWVKEFKNWREMLGLGKDGYGDFTLDIVDTLEELRDRIPAKAFRTAADVVANPASQDLDI